MKTRMVWRYLITYPGQSTWYGNCRTWWESESAEGAVKTRERVMAVGDLKDCWVLGCGERHVSLPSPS